MSFLNKFLGRLSLLSVIIMLFSVLSTSSSSAAGYGEKCEFSLPGVAPASGNTDRSDCDIPLRCDITANYCLRSGEQGCLGPNIGCTVGMICQEVVGYAAGDKFATPAVGAAGVCIPPLSADSENNAIGDLLCNLYMVATGKIGRGIVVIVVVVTGVTFYLGKISWGTVFIIFIGSACVFGAPTIVSIIVGKGFVCK